jgi:nicotinamide-nucleotide amidase
LSIEAEICELLKQKNLTFGTVESATGGLIANRITNVPGASDSFKGSVVSYSNEIKANVVGVEWAALTTHGAVSKQVAEQMAAGGRNLLKVDICVADTGIAGPGGDTPGKPVGLFYIGLAHKGGAENRMHIFKSDRIGNKDQAAETALQWVKEYLTGLK